MTGAGGSTSLSSLSDSFDDCRETEGDRERRRIGRIWLRRLAIDDSLPAEALRMLFGSGIGMGFTSTSLARRGAA